MANRSDFFSAKLPRSIKRMMTLDGTIDSREHRMLWIKAHECAVRAKRGKLPGDVRAAEAAAESTEASTES